MNKFIVILIVILTLVFTAVTSQSINWEDCITPVEYNYSSNFKPAPCSIRADNLYDNAAWSIKVGTYSSFIVSFTDVFCIKYNQLFYYYYSFVFNTKVNAMHHLKKLQYEGYFCDAQVVRFPFNNVITFQHE